MRISHHQRNRIATSEVFTGMNGDYYLKTYLGDGTGSLTEPCVYVHFSEEELYTFAVDILGMIASEEARV